MPARLTIGGNQGLAKLRWSITGMSDEIICTFGYRVNNTSLSGTSATNIDPQVAAQSISDAWLGAWPGSGLSGAYTFRGCDTAFYAIGQTAGEAARVPTIGSHSIADVGSYGGGTLTPNTAVLVEKQTGLGGRQFKGRMYLPGGYIPADQVDDQGNLSSAQITGTQNRMTAFRDNLADVDVDLTLMLFHAEVRRAGIVVGPAAQPTVVTGFTVDGRVATQRRRMNR